MAAGRQQAVNKPPVDVGPDARRAASLSASGSERMSSHRELPRLYSPGFSVAADGAART